MNLGDRALQRREFVPVAQGGDTDRDDLTLDVLVDRDRLREIEDERGGIELGAGEAGAALTISLAEMCKRLPVSR